MDVLSCIRSPQTTFAVTTVEGRVAGIMGVSYSPVAPMMAVQKSTCRLSILYTTLHQPAQQQETYMAAPFSHNNKEMFVELALALSMFHDLMIVTHTMDDDEKAILKEMRVCVMSIVRKFGEVPGMGQTAKVEVLMPGSNVYVEVDSMDAAITYVQAERAAQGKPPLPVSDIQTLIVRKPPDAPP